MKIEAIINPHSGSVPPDAEPRLHERLDALGHQCRIATPEPADLVATVDEALERHPDLMIVWAGDGTCACVLERAQTSDVPVLALPGGTMNVLHRHVHGGKTDWERCLEGALSKGRERRMPAGIAGARQFYVAAMIGNVADLAAPREALRMGDPIGAVQALADGHGLELAPRLHYLRPADGSATAAGTRKPASSIAIMLSPEEPACFEVAVIAPQHALDLASIGLDALLSGWREADGIDYFKAGELRLEAGTDEPLSVMLDGEALKVPHGMKITHRPDAVRVLSAAGDE